MIKLILTIIQVVSRFGVYSKRHAQFLFRCPSRTMSRDQISSCFLHTRSARISHSARTHTATLPKPLAVVMATGPPRPIKTPPLLSPLATAAAFGAPRTRTPSDFFFFLNNARRSLSFRSSVVIRGHLKIKLKISSLA